MTAPLRDRARAAQERAHNGDRPDQPATTQAPAAGEREPQRLPRVDAPEGIDADPADIPVQVALARAMRDLGTIAKADRFDGGNAGRYNFRGVDRVVNAVAAVLRKHGLVVLPEVRTVDYRDIARQGGGRSHECVVTVAWHWYGPRGDELVAITQGEALDTSDKATAKAQSVAWRVCLIQALAIPTGDPDPDSVHIERGEQVISPIDYAAEIMDERTAAGRIRQIGKELRDEGRLGVTVPTPRGDMSLAALIEWVWSERKAGRDPFPADDPTTAPSDVDGGEPA